MSSITILGCGWLGFPFARYMIEKGFVVRGSTRDPKKLSILKNNSIKGFLININPDIKSKKINEFLDSQILFVNFPPQRRDDIEEYHQLQFSNLINEILKSSIKKVLFASSTSVYPDTNGIVDEECSLEPEKKSGKALLKVEKMLMNEKKFETVIIRFAGLIGYERSPLNSIKKKNLLLNPETRLNLIHRDDCIKISSEIIEKKIFNVILNACCDNHPTRKEYYSNEAEKYNIELPDFDESQKTEYKIVDNKKLKELLRYKFIYPDPCNIPYNYL
ncbi:MAG: NAD-dependent epimerase/dehydratase family protein [Thermodesulfobacteriota bacterium]